jgi:hypothetical protein
MGQRRSLKGRVEEAAERALAEQRYVSPIDVCVGMRWLHSTHVESWRQGRDAIDTVLTSFRYPVDDPPLVL